MKNLKKFENFDGFDTDEEADQIHNDQIFADSHDAHDAQYSQNDEESVDVLARFEEEFGDNEPSSQELMEFYHKLRTEGVNGIEIFDTLLSNNKIGEGDDENYSDDDEEDDIHLQHRNMSSEDEEQYERRSLKRFKRFNENSHDWRANAFPGATEEEIEAEIQKIEAEREKNHRPATKAVPTKQMTEEEEENYYRATGWATGDYGQYNDIYKTKQSESPKEEVEEKPTIGSKIKSFLGFNK
jgi:hypothetical protein